MTSVQTNKNMFDEAVIGQKFLYVGSPTTDPCSQIFSSTNGVGGLNSLSEKLCKVLELSYETNDLTEILKNMADTIIEIESQINLNGTQNTSVNLEYIPRN